MLPRFRRCVDLRDDAAQGCIVPYALAVARAMNLDHTSAVLGLYNDAPGRADRILSVAIDKLRANAYVAILKAFAPTLHVARAHALLGYEDSPIAGDAYLSANGAVTNDTRTLILIKQSRDNFNKRKQVQRVQDALDDYQSGLELKPKDPRAP